MALGVKAEVILHRAGAPGFAIFWLTWVPTPTQHDIFRSHVPGFSQPIGRHNRSPARECWEKVALYVSESLQRRHKIRDQSKTPTSDPIPLVPS